MLPPGIPDLEEEKGDWVANRAADGGGVGGGGGGGSSGGGGGSGGSGGAGASSHMLGEGGPQGCLSRSLSSTCRGYWREQLPLNLSALGTAPSIYTGTVRPAETLHYRLTLPLPPGTRSGRRFVDGAAAWPPIAATDCGH